MTAGLVWHVADFFWESSFTIKNEKILKMFQKTHPVFFYVLANSNLSLSSFQKILLHISNSCLYVSRLQQDN